MKLYENAYPSVYEEIKTWYPVWYRDVFEMDALWRVWGGQLDEIQAGIIRAVDNNFIDYADAETLTKWETLFNVTYDGPRTLAERRNLLKALLLGMGHIGQKEIKEIISVFTNGQIEVQLIGGMIRITVTRDFGDNFNLYDCNYILDNKIPAHLALDMVDKLLPVSAFTDNRFIFRDLRLALAVQNRCLIRDGVQLNGEKTLDGTWLLDSIRPGLQFPAFYAAIAIPKNHGEYAPRALDFSEYKLRNGFDLSVGLAPALRAENSFDFSYLDSAFKTAFHNYGVQLQGVGLNGKYELDGTWNLDAEKDAILSGIAPRKLSMAGYSIQNSFETSARLLLTASAAQQGNLRQGLTTIQGLGASQSFGLSGSVVMDGRWTLNGDFILNGAMNLAQIYEQEDL